MGCNWGEANHTYFQLANLFLAFTYFVPSTLKGLIILRLLLGTAGLFFSLWAAIILCSPDTFGWNFAFMVINFAHVTYLWYTMRPIKFQDELEVVYENMFEVLKVARWQFKAIASCGIKQEYQRGDVIASESATLCEELSILTSGSVRVYKNNVYIHRIHAYEFLNSPEYVASSQAGGSPIAYEVTAVSDGCIVVSWKRSLLRKILRHDKFLNNIFDSIIGQDVTKKLFKFNKKVVSEDNDNFFQANRFIENDLSDHNADTKSIHSTYSRIYTSSINPATSHYVKNSERAEKERSITMTLNGVHSTASLTPTYPSNLHKEENQNSATVDNKSLEEDSIGIVISEH